LEIIWLGHSWFRLKGKTVNIITDPCSPDLGYSINKLSADIVTISHFHPGHCFIQAIKGEFKTIRGPGEYELKNTFITGIPAWHDSVQGEKLGKNTVYLIEIDNLVLCHLGDVGHLPSSELIEEIGDIDVLFIPVGGRTTLSGIMAAEMVRRLTPKLVIPMHYKTPALSRDLEPVDKFLREMGIREVSPQQKLSLSRSTLPLNTQVIVLDYLH
jgi:L-ascorbate metabolism protein UlaG (beta-lactamase superfamily)